MTSALANALPATTTKNGGEDDRAFGPESVDIRRLALRAMRYASEPAGLVGAGQPAAGTPPLELPGLRLRVRDDGVLLRGRFSRSISTARRLKPSTAIRSNAACDCRTAHATRPAPGHCAPCDWVVWAKAQSCIGFRLGPLKSRTINDGANAAFGTMAAHCAAEGEVGWLPRLWKTYCRA